FLPRCRLNLDGKRESKGRWGRKFCFWFAPIEPQGRKLLANRLEVPDLNRVEVGCVYQLSALGPEAQRANERRVGRLQLGKLTSRNRIDKLNEVPCLEQCKEPSIAPKCRQAW